MSSNMGKHNQLMQSMPSPMCPTVRCNSMPIPVNQWNNMSNMPHIWSNNNTNNNSYMYHQNHTQTTAHTHAPQPQPHSQPVYQPQPHPQQNIAYRPTLPFISIDIFNQMSMNSWNMNRMPLISPQYSLPIINNGPYLPQTSNETPVLSNMKESRNHQIVPHLPSNVNNSNCSDNSKQHSSHTSRNKLYSNHNSLYKRNDKKPDNNYRFKNKVFYNSNERKYNQRNEKTFHKPYNNGNNNNKSNSYAKPEQSSHESDDFKRKLALNTKNNESNNSTSNSNLNSDEISQNNSAMKKEIRKESNIDSEELFTKPVNWLRCSPADLYYEQMRDKGECIIGMSRLIELRNKFKELLLDRSVRAKALKSPFTFPPRKVKLRPPKSIVASSESSCSESESTDGECEDTAYEELQRKKTHPWRLHEELWYNDPGEMNDGPLCRCSAKARKTGIRHGIYPGEEHLNSCDPNSNNRDRLFHYRISITPNTNFLTKFPTMISHDGHDFIFEGFSLFSHSPLNNLPPCKVIRFNIEYTITFVSETFPTNFNVEDLEYFTTYVFIELLELVDLNLKASGDEGCPRFHFMPRFSRLLDDDGKELLSLNVILQYLINSSKSVVESDKLKHYKDMNEEEWTSIAKQLKGMIVTYPGMKPCSLRVDQIDRETDDLIDNNLSENDGYPVIVHFGIRPPQLSYAGNPKYQKAWRDYVKFRHLLANKKKVSYIDKQTLLQKEEKLQEMRMKNDLKRDVTVVISSKGFHRTGIQCDIVQHSLLLPVLVCHLRFHQSLQYLEGIIGFSFNDRYLLQLALTHPSYRENFGTNPDHARNALTNCGIRQPQYGDRRVHFMNTRKRGINMLINIMSRFGCNEETVSNINHNERLEFLGDAVVEFLSSIHLYFMFPDLEEGGLATYRAALVQNQQLAVLAKKLQLDKFMLYAHGSDLCHDLELRHAMANCFEALMGALFLDGGIHVPDRVFSNTLFNDNPDLLNVWVNYKKHPLQRQEPNGDRHYIDSIPRLKELRKFEEITGIEFTHIRLLARAFTHRSVGFNNLTLGSNQRMEFLGDTVLQLVASEYLYKFFPEHHEGHLSLLRSSLVNNKTQAVVCDDLGMTQIAIYNYAKGDLKTKDRADLLEAFLGALYVDKGLAYCRVFCEVCFFPRLEDFIMNQDWNDPKSKLQQCCLTLRSVDGGEPDIPVYKVIECRGPTNTRVYVVAVYFRNQRLSTGTGHSIQEAEMNAASNALESSRELFPQLSHQKKVIERSVKSVKIKAKKDKRKDKTKFKGEEKKKLKSHKH